MKWRSGIRLQMSWSLKDPVEKVKVILWKGHCSVHENFTVANVEDVRKNHPRHENHRPS